MQTEQNKGNKGAWGVTVAGEGAFLEGRGGGGHVILTNIRTPKRADLLKDGEKPGPGLHGWLEVPEAHPSYYAVHHLQQFKFQGWRRPKSGSGRMRVILLPDPDPEFSSPGPNPTLVIYIWLSESIFSTW
jgi:hypothetical protein